jgi:RNA polymerase sigma-70 factor, ECF subfamily
MTREPRHPEPSLPSDMDQDKDLIARTLAGENAAFDALLTRYRNRIFGLLVHMVRDGQEADDMAQEVFVRAYYGLKNFRGECSFFTWLYRIAANVLYTQTRRAARRRQIHEQAWQEITRRSACRTPAEAAESGELQELVMRALPLIDVRLREVLVLRDLEGFEEAEVAQLLKVPRGTVKSRLFRAREDLRRIILNQFKEKGRQS